MSKFRWHPIIYASILTIIIILLTDYYDNNQMFILGSILAPLLGYLISEVIIGIKVKKRVAVEGLKLLPRDPESEYKIFNILIIGFSIAYPLLLLIIMI